MKTMLNSLTFTAGMALLLFFAGTPGARAAETATNQSAPAVPVDDRFENFHMQDGMPTHKVHCVLRASDGKLWWAPTTGAGARGREVPPHRVEDG